MQKDNNPLRESKWLRQQLSTYISTSLSSGQRPGCPTRLLRLAQQLSWVVVKQSPADLPSDISNHTQQEDLVQWFIRHLWFNVWVTEDGADILREEARKLVDSIMLRIHHTMMSPYVKELVGDDWLGKHLLEAVISKQDVDQDKIAMWIYENYLLRLSPHHQIQKLLKD